MLPLLKHRRSILKHTPGGQPHDQEEHGNWSQGASPEPPPSLQTPAQVEPQQGTAATEQQTVTRQTLAPFREHWPEGSWDPELHDEISRAQRAVFIKMQADPRWDDALSEWETLDDSAIEGFDEGVSEAHELRGQLNNVATEIYGEGWWEGGIDEDNAVWGLRDSFENRVLKVVESDNPFDPMTENLLELGDSGDSLMEAYGHDLSEELIGTGGWKSSVLNRIEAEVGPFTQQDDYEKVSFSDDQWLITDIDVNNEMVLLTKQGQMGQLFAGTEASRVLNPDFIGDPVAAFSPQAESQWVSYHTLFNDDILESFANNEAFETGVKIYSEDGYWSIRDDLDALETNWSDFTSQWGVPPSDLEGLLDAGMTEELASSAGLQSDRDSLVVNDSFNGTGVTIANPDIPEDAPRILRDLWSNTSADDHPWALAVQMATAEEFGIEDFQLRSAHSASTIEIAEQIKGDYGTLLKTWARAVYDTTQADLAARGWDMIPVVRGMKTNLPETNGWQPVGDVGFDLNPLSSFSVQPESALMFTGRRSSGTKSLLRGWVPRERVWGSSLTGNGAIKEQELILLGGEDSFHGEQYHTINEYEITRAFD